MGLAISRGWAGTAQVTDLTPPVVYPLWMVVSGQGSERQM